MLNYDPNIHPAVHVVRLRYALWDHHAEAVVEIRGGDRGFEVLEWALEEHWTQLAQAAPGDAPPVLRLTNAAGEVLEQVDDALLQVEWLKDLCIGAEILSIAPYDSALAAPRAAELPA